MLAFFLLQGLDKLYLIVPDATIHTTGRCCVCVGDGRGTIWSNKLSIPEHFRRTKKSSCNFFRLFKTSATTKTET